VRAVFDVEEPLKRARQLPAARADLSEKARRLSMILPARSAAQRGAARRVRGGDACQHRERCGHTRGGEVIRIVCH